MGEEGGWFPGAQRVRCAPAEGEDAKWADDLLLGRLGREGQGVGRLGERKKGRTGHVRPISWARFGGLGQKQGLNRKQIFQIFAAGFERIQIDFKGF
jgi:hypothetical protein